MDHWLHSSGFLYLCEIVVHRSCVKHNRKFVNRNVDCFSKDFTDIKTVIFHSFVYPIGLSTIGIL